MFDSWKRLFAATACFTLFATSCRSTVDQAQVSQDPARDPQAPSPDPSDLAWQHIADLDLLEWSEASIAAGRGIMLFGETRNEPGRRHYLYAYDATARKIVASYPLPHRAQFLGLRANGDFLAAGKSVSPEWAQHLTTLSGDAARFAVQTDSSHGPRLFEQFAELDGSLFASDPGSGSVMDISARPSRTVLEGLSNPGPVLASQGLIAALDIGAGAPGDENIIAIDPAKGTSRSKWPIGKGKGRGMSALVAIPGTTLLAVNEWRANRVILVDLQTLETVREFVTDEMPEGLAVIGSCIAVAATEARKLHVFDAMSTQTTPLASIDYSAHGDRLRSVRAVAADPSLAGMTLYLRSVYPWDGAGKKAQSSMFRLDILDADLLKACGRG